MKYRIELEFESLTPIPHEMLDEFVVVVVDQLKSFEDGSLEASKDFGNRTTLSPVIKWERKRI